MAKKNLFEMGAHFEEGWQSDNKNKPTTNTKKILPPAKHQLHFAKEKRRGKVVTIVKPFYVEHTTLKTLLKLLKKKLGIGGTLKEEQDILHLEFQGEVAEPLHTHLTQEGYRFTK
jgi:translation initiation factor 1